jgi:hypothetical protein
VDYNDDMEIETYTSLVRKVLSIKVKEGAENQNTTTDHADTTEHVQRSLKTWLAAAILQRLTNDGDANFKYETYWQSNNDLQAADGNAKKLNKALMTILARFLQHNDTRAEFLCRYKKAKRGLDQSGSNTLYVVTGVKIAKDFQYESFELREKGDYRPFKKGYLREIVVAYQLAEIDYTKATRSSTQKQRQRLELKPVLLREKQQENLPYQSSVLR